MSEKHFIQRFIRKIACWGMITVAASSSAWGQAPAALNLSAAEPTPHPTNESSELVVRLPAIDEEVQQLRQQVSQMQGDLKQIKSATSAAPASAPAPDRVRRRARGRRDRARRVAL